MKKRALKIIKQVFFFLFLAVSIFVGIELYRVFMAYTPGGDFNLVFTATVGISPFVFMGVFAAVFISFPIVIGALELYFALATSYIRSESDKGQVMLSDKAIESFVRDTVSQLNGVDHIEVSVDIFRDNEVGLRAWIDSDEKSDFVRFSERIQQRVLQDLEFNFGINKIKYFKVFLESTDITAADKGYKVEYK